MPRERRHPSRPGAARGSLMSVSLAGGSPPPWNFSPKLEAPTSGAKVRSRSPPLAVGCQGGMLASAEDNDETDPCDISVRIVQKTRSVEKGHAAPEGMAISVRWREISPTLQDSWSSLSTVPVGTRASPDTASEHNSSPPRLTRRSAHEGRGTKNMGSTRNSRPDRAAQSWTPPPPPEGGAHRYVRIHALRRRCIDMHAHTGHKGA